MKHENAHLRGKGGIGGPDLPMATAQNTESDMGKSMPDTYADDLGKGYCGLGSITSSTGSNPAGMTPGRNNKGSANRA